MDFHNRPSRRLPRVVLCVSAILLAADLAAAQPPSHLAEPFPYDLASPHAVYPLPAELKEASAVSYISADELGLVQDESGVIYIYSLSRRRVTARTRFSGNGDFEGLAIHGDTAYVLNSNGILHVVRGYRGEKPAVDKLRTQLRQRDDAEGLSRDPFSGRLLVLGKEAPRLDGRRRDGLRAVYALAPYTLAPLDAPVVTLEMDRIRDAYLAEAGNAGDRKRAVDLVVRKPSAFKPSDLAVDPISGNLYLIAAVGRLLVVCDQEGRVLHVRHLPQKVFPQPEGITFSPGGDLFIVNESRGGHALLLQFTPGGADRPGIPGADIAQPRE